MRKLVVNKKTRNILPLDKVFFKDIEILTSNYLPDGIFVIIFPTPESFFGDMFIYKYKDNDILFVRKLENKFSYKPFVLKEDINA